MAPGHSLDVAPRLTRGRATLTLTRNKSAKVAALKRRPKEGSRKTDLRVGALSETSAQPANQAEPDQAPEWPPRIRRSSRQARSASPPHFCATLRHGTQHSQHTN